MKRFSALVAALMLCLALCVPCFASNNAQWRKWVITAESQMSNESGTMSKYFQLTPFQNGEIYAAVVSSHRGSFKTQSGTVTTSNLSFYLADNYPDWWRSALPLGSRSYVQADVKTLQVSNTYNGDRFNVLGADLFVFDSNNAIVSTVDIFPTSSGAVPGAYGSVSTSSAPSVFLSSGMTLNGAGTVSASSLSISPSQSYVFSPNDFVNLVFAFPISYSGVGPSCAPVYLTNLTTDRIVFVVDGGTANQYTHATIEFSYWVDANKLPSGLQVGDEFPADTDAFDKLRDDLIDQFPESSENIENGKSTLTGWNDTETVDTDVASTSISALNAMFQNLGQFLFIVSLMVFGAVVLRMFIKKAVDG